MENTSGATHQIPTECCSRETELNFLHLEQWRLASSLSQLLEQVDLTAPKRDRKSDGTIGDSAHRSRKSDHNPWVKDGEIGVVTAIDITNDPINSCNAQLIVDSLVASRDSRIKYLIFCNRIISSIEEPWIWRPYHGQNPHIKHFHLSVLPEKALYDCIDNWCIE